MTEKTEKPMDVWEGTVVAVGSSNPKKYGIKLDTHTEPSDWLNGWGKSPVEKGDYVEVSFVVSAYGNDIKQVIRKTPSANRPIPEGKPIEPGQTQQRTPGYNEERDSQICRMSVLKSAVELVAPLNEGLDAKEKLALITAKRFEKYVHTGE